VSCVSNGSNNIHSEQDKIGMRNQRPSGESKLQFLKEEITSLPPAIYYL
jgi:hypothetical protein